MIIIFAGTKAEYIKLAPLLNILKKNCTNFLLIESGQHYYPNKIIRKHLSIREPDFIIKPMINRSKMLYKINWAFLILIKILTMKVPILDKNIAIVQGDTISSLFSFLLAKRLKYKVVHLEAGLTSRSLFEPFPEEIIRRTISAYSDYLFAPSDEAYEYLLNSKKKKNVYNTFGNTGFDSCLNSLRQDVGPANQYQYVVVAIHRIENIYLPNRLNTILSVIEYLVQKIEVFFVEYSNNNSKLMKNKFLKWNLNHRTKISYINYYEFVNFLFLSKFVITDGGTLQEECSYLEIPCLLLRKRTERSDGLDSQVKLIAPHKENIKRIQRWIKTQINNQTDRRNKENYIRKLSKRYDKSPSERAIDLVYYLHKSG